MEPAPNAYPFHVETNLLHSKCILPVEVLVGVAPCPDSAVSRSLQLLSAFRALRLTTCTENGVL